jgi:PadR family transcriptional regulator, regulatory protein PadR
MPHEGLGDFEQMVLLAVLRLSQGDEDVYGVPIVEEIERRTRRKVARAAVYITMRRLERKGLLASWTSEPAAERGGKARHCVKVTAVGNKTLREARRAMNQMWAGIDAGVEDHR